MRRFISTFFFLMTLSIMLTMASYGQSVTGSRWKLTAGPYTDSRTYTVSPQGGNAALNFKFGDLLNHSEIELFTDLTHLKATLRSFSISYDKAVPESSRLSPQQLLALLYWQTCYENRKQGSESQLIALMTPYSIIDEEELRDLKITRAALPTAVIVNILKQKRDWYRTTLQQITAHPSPLMANAQQEVDWFKDYLDKLGGTRGDLEKFAQNLEAVKLASQDKALQTRLSTRIKFYHTLKDAFSVTKDQDAEFQLISGKKASILSVDKILIVFQFLSALSQKMAISVELADKLDSVLAYARENHIALDTDFVTEAQKIKAIAGRLDASVISAMVETLVDWLGQSGIQLATDITEGAAIELAKRLAVTMASTSPELAGYASSFATSATSIFAGISLGALISDIAFNTSGIYDGIMAADYSEQCSSMFDTIINYANDQVKKPKSTNGSLEAWANSIYFRELSIANYHAQYAETLDGARLAKLIASWILHGSLEDTLAIHKTFALRITKNSDEWINPPITSNLLSLYSMSQPVVANGEEKSSANDLLNLLNSATDSINRAATPAGFYQAATTRRYSEFLKIYGQYIDHHNAYVNALQRGKDQRFDTTWRTTMIHYLNAVQNQATLLGGQLMVPSGAQKYDDTRLSISGETRRLVIDYNTFIRSKGVEGASAITNHHKRISILFLDAESEKQILEKLITQQVIASKTDAVPITAAKQNNGSVAPKHETKMDNSMFVGLGTSNIVSIYDDKRTVLLYDDKGLRKWTRKAGLGKYLSVKVNSVECASDDGRVLVVAKVDNYYPRNGRFYGHYSTWSENSGFRQIAPRDQISYQMGMDWRFALSSDGHRVLVHSGLGGPNSVYEYDGTRRSFKPLVSDSTLLSHSRSSSPSSDIHMIALAPNGNSVLTDTGERVSIQQSIPQISGEMKSFLKQVDFERFEIKVSRDMTSAFAIALTGPTTPPSGSSYAEQLAYEKQFSYRLMRWDEGKGTRNLGNLGNGPFYDHILISSNGAVVATGLGMNGQSGTKGTGRPCVWTEKLGLIPLPNLFQKYGLAGKTDGWKFTSVTWVSADGEVLGGDGIRSNGRQESWFVVLPSKWYMSLSAASINTHVPTSTISIPPKERAVNTVRNFIIAVKKNDWSSVHVLYAKWPGKDEITAINGRRNRFLSGKPTLNGLDQSGPFYAVSFGKGIAGFVYVDKKTFKINNIFWEDD